MPSGQQQHARTIETMPVAIEPIARGLLPPVGA
jgi:hypothetical protein